MPAQSESFDVAVVGGGAIGLACAWRAAQRGARVVVIDAGRARRVARRRGHARAGLRGRVRRARAAASWAWRARAATRPSAPSSRTRATARRARWSSRATATRPRRSTASPRSGASSACRSSGCGRRRRAGSSPRSRRRSGSRCDIEGDHAIDPRMLVAALAPRVHRRAAAPRAPPACASRASASPACELDRRSPIAAEPGRRRRRRRRRAARACPSTRACRSARSRARSCACATRAAPAWSSARSAASSVVLRPARRRPLRARRDDGGARLGHDARPRAASTSCCAT